jgi:hypothetical protein
MPERIIELTTDSLMDDNTSSTAVNRLRKWQVAADENQLIAVIACSDSRLVLPYETAIHIYAITAGGPRSPYLGVLRDDRVKAAATVCHHDGFDVSPGRCPGGCGGRGAKEGMVNGSNDNDALKENSIEAFIDRHVWSSDLVIQSHAAGAFTADRSGKDTLAVTQDNRDLRFTPLFVFTDGGNDVKGGVPQHLVTASHYFPGMIYENGLPALRRNKIPNTFDDFLKGNEEIATSLADKYPNLADLQADQNPSLLVLSTDIRPLKVRYPATTEVPGSVFSISVPQSNIDGDRRIDPQHLVTSLQQADYPVGHFSNLRTILIETRAMNKSEGVATEFIRQVWMQNWLKDPLHQVLVGEVEKGRTRMIRPFSLTV